MKRFLLSLFIASCCQAADARFMWVPSVSVTPDGPRYGAVVLLRSDNPAVTAFRVTIAYQSASGVRTIERRADRGNNPAYPPYDTQIVIPGIADPQFRVVSIRAVAISENEQPTPAAGKEYGAPEFSEHLFTDDASTRY